MQQMLILQMNGYNNDTIGPINLALALVIPLASWHEIPSNN